MRFFAVLIALVALTFSARVRAQDNDPPTPLDAPATTEAPAPIPPPIAPPTDAAPLAPEKPPADAPAPATPAPDEAPAGGCGAWPLAVSGGVFEAGALGVGGLMFCIGGALASIQPTSSSDNCAQACLDILIALAVIAIGLILVAASLVILGPIASVAVTVAMSLAAVGAGRTLWPAVVGGSIGVVTAVAGIGLVVWGFTNAQTLPFVGGEPLTLADAPHAALVGGMVLTAAAGIVSLGAAVALDAAFGGPSESASDNTADSASERAAALGAPAARAQRAPARVVHAMAY